MLRFPLKTLDTIGNCQRPVLSLGVLDLNICTKQQICENLNSTGRRSCVIIMKERKNNHVAQVVCFQMLYFRTSKSNSEVSKSNSWKITSFSKTIYLRGSRFSQCLILSAAVHYSLQLQEVISWIAPQATSFTVAHISGKSHPWNKMLQVLTLASKIL